MSRDPVRGVLFDVDGTLVDSVDAHARAWESVFREAGYSVPYERLRGMIGMGGDKLLPAAIGVSADSPEGRRLAERRTSVFMARELPAIRPTRGAREILKALRGIDDLRIGFATSAKPAELRALLAIVDAEDLLPKAADAGEVRESKPDPDVVHAALTKNHLEPSSTVLVGDTRYDIEAGTKAGVATIAVRCGGWRDKDLVGAVAIFDDPADLLAHLAVTPLASLGLDQPASLRT